eukprot:TRINITY_DN2560_c0_g1_i1.p1 TRINITY_DN2560_c0_g1~~TRINITY_DN2560_c0_g1_i1.p1  ORF type:complete len:474 (+),score=137.92 TRINITY_DN2560_c0_g1_i1:75-1424(+)
MAGSVGCAIAGRPGYAGYVPSSEQPLPCTNSLITERVPVSLRKRACQPGKGLRAGAADSMAPSPPERPRRRPDSAPSPGPPRDCSVFFLPKRMTSATVYADDAVRGCDVQDRRTAWQYPLTKTHLFVASQKRHAEAATSPPGSKFTATALYEDREESVGPVRDRAFFSRLKGREQKASDEQHAQPLGQTKVTRSSGKQNVERTSAATLSSVGAPQPRKGFDEADRPAPPTYKPMARRKLLGAEPVSANEFVRFKNAMAEMSTNQLDYGCRGANPQSRVGKTVSDLASAASTLDLCGGTAKALRGLRIPGYVGHVPASAGNLRRVHAAGSQDLVKQNARNLILLNGCSRTLPGYCGFEARSIINDTGKPSQMPAEATSSARVQSRAQAGDREKAMNRPDYGKAASIRNFFTHGEGMSDNTIADQYFVKYRPMEGLLKMGAPAERVVPAAR